MNLDKLPVEARKLRRKILRMITLAQGGHLGSSLSEADILAALYFHVLRIFPENPGNPGRDRFVLSKGHASEGLYAALAMSGFFPEAWLDSYLKDDCPLTVHPTNHVPGIELCTGALGHGLSAACGMALGARKQGKTWRTFVLSGDGELQEGSNWEAAMAAAHFKLGNLCWIIDNNGIQLNSFISETMNIEPLADKLFSFGFDVREVDGTDAEKIARLLDDLDYAGEKPHAVIAKTIKGRGVSFMENVPEWHHRIPTEAECARALEELV